MIFLYLNFFKTWYRRTHVVCSGIMFRGHTSEISAIFQIAPSNTQRFTHQSPGIVNVTSRLLSTTTRPWQQQWLLPWVFCSISFSVLIWRTVYFSKFERTISFIYLCCYHNSNSHYCYISYEVHPRRVLSFYPVVVLNSVSQIVYY